MVAVFDLIDTILSLYSFCLLVYVIISWLTAFNIINSYQPLVRTINDFLSRLIEPAVRHIRRFIPPFNGLDLSVLVLFLVIRFLRIFIASSIAPIFY